MSRLKLTDKIAREAELRATPYSIRDTEVRGFRLLIMPSGAKSWQLRYTVKGTGAERLSTIGSFPTWSAVEARKRAEELKRKVDTGGDPTGEAREQRAAPTIADLIERYTAEHLPSKRPESRYEDLSLIRQWVLPELGEHKVTDIKTADIERLHRRIAARTPVRANRVVALLSIMFSLAVRWEYRLDNPAKGVARTREHPRARYLTVDEIGRLVAALAKHRTHNPASTDAIELLLLTGARRAEVLSATWSQFDLDAGIWTKPPASTKQQREHRVPLSPQAVELLKRRLPGARSGTVVKLRPSAFVFPGGGSSGHQVEIRKVWLAACKAAGLDGVRLHDLRHSYASLLVSAGRSLPEIGALLGHRQVQTTARYSHLFDEPLRAATGLVGKIVSGAK